MIENFSIEENKNMLILGAIVFMMVVYYVFFKETPQQKKTGGNKIVVVYLFKADWCPHCQNFMPTWKKMKKKYEGQVEFKTLDSDKDTQEMKKHEIEGFPTIKNSLNQEYQGDRSEEDLNKWIKSKCIRH